MSPLIFVDTSFWLALRNAEDSRHREAATLASKHRGVPWVTSNHVRGETWTVLRRRANHRSAIAFLDALATAPRIQLAHVSERLESEAIAWLKQHDERSYSFVDATSFALMRSMRIREALAFDGDFSAAGFVELRAD